MARGQRTGGFDRSKLSSSQVEKITRPGWLAVIRPLLAFKTPWGAWVLGPAAATIPQELKQRHMLRAATSFLMTVKFHVYFALPANSVAAQKMTSFDTYSGSTRSLPL